MEITPFGLKPLGYQQLAVSNTAVAMTVPAGAVRAVCMVEGQPIRYRLDGTDPTDAIGFQVKADVSFELVGSAVLKAFKAIRTGTDAKISIHYF